jgi:hypothetical protein
VSELKDALERRSERFDLEPGAMDRFFSRRERRDRRRRVAAICLALGVTAAGALLAVRALSSNEPVPAAPKTDEELLAELAGTYTITLSGPTPSFVTENDLAGEYSMTLRPDGVIELSAPAAFVEGRNPSGITFRVSGDEFTTNAFVNVTCHSTVGRYRWSLIGDSLTFDPIAEACPLRRTLFASKAWERQT